MIMTDKIEEQIPEWIKELAKTAIVIENADGSYTHILNSQEIFDG